MTDLPAIARDLHDLAQRANELARSLEGGLALLAKPEPCHDAVDPLLDQHDLATLLRVGERTLRRMRHDGRVPEPIMLGSKPRWLRTQIDAWLAREARS
ncbi:MAG: helix-turn-helix domain-containing protein [Planctomycetes bacterium]|nr:helix-turn-helix domain-containing protein [Planctomycetota bacterium]